MTPLESYLCRIPSEQHALVRALDAVIRGAAPRLTPGIKWGNLTYHLSKNVCQIVCHKRHVNLQMFLGAQIDDPRGLLERTGKDMRHVKFVNANDVDRSCVAGLVKQSVGLAGR
jgi:hypothetical protein